MWCGVVWCGVVWCGVVWCDACCCVLLRVVACCCVLLRVAACCCVYLCAGNYAGRAASCEKFLLHFHLPYNCNGMHTTTPSLYQNHHPLLTTSTQRSNKWVIILLCFSTTFHLISPLLFTRSLNCIL
jgi:hypothetical protein